MSDEQEGVSSRQLLAAFFAVVVLCAVFFSLGFFLGHKEGSPEGGLASEQVPSSSDAPAAVNSPAQQSESDASSVAAASPAASSNQDAVMPAPAASNSPDSSATPTAAEARAPAVAPRQQPAQPRTAQPVALQT